jgi:hypothetical protein
VRDATVVFLDDIDDGPATQEAAIGWLTAGGRVERGAIEPHLELASFLTKLDDARLELA